MNLISRSGLLAAAVLTLLTFGCSKPGYQGVCIVEGEDGTPDSCWLDHKTAENCRGKFVAQPSRDKGEIYCALEGFKGDAKTGVLHRKKTK